MSELTKDNCSMIRELLDMRLDPDEILSEQQNLTADNHLKECGSCEMWYRQTASVIETAKVMPQFDFSEQLTQSIMNEVVAYDTAQRQPMKWLVNVMAVIGGLCLIFLFDPSETIWGIASWVVGLLLMFGLQLLLSDSKGEEQFV